MIRTNPVLSAPAAGVILALVGGVASLAILGHASSGGTAGIGVEIGFAIWVALPFVLALAVNLYCLRAPAGHPLSIAAVVASGMVALSALLYARSVFAPRSSTEALIFVFLPLWSLLCEGAVILALFWGIRWLRGDPGS
jgi:hypothetical protein